MAEQPQQASVESESITGLVESWDLEPELKNPTEDAIKTILTSLWVQGADPSAITIDKALVDALIGEFDQQISAQVNEILHHEDFQKLESAWTGLKYLIDNTEFRENIKIEMVSATKEELLEDFQDATDFQKTGLFKTVYTWPYNALGGKPYGLMMGNYSFDHSNSDVDLLTEISRVAAVSKCPFIAGAGPSMLGRKDKSFADLPRKAEMYEIFDQPQYTKWNAFRDSDDARYIGLAMPRFLLRKPYTVEDKDVKDFKFEEDVRVENHDRYLWGNAAYAMAARMTNSFAQHRWYSHVVGPQSGGAVDDLALHQYEAMGQWHTKIPTETLISEDMDVDLCNYGFTPLVYRQDSDNACFFDAPSVKSVGRFPDTEEGHEDETRARLGASLPYLMISCRIAHFLKVIWRENMGKIMDADKMTGQIEKWLKQYCNAAPDISEEEACRRPLREIQVHSEPVPGRPGYYKSRVQMVPHYKLKGMDVTLNMVGTFDPPPS